MRPQLTDKIIPSLDLGIISAVRKSANPLCGRKKNNSSQKVTSGTIFHVSRWSGPWFPMAVRLNPYPIKHSMKKSIRLILLLPLFALAGVSAEEPAAKGFRFPGGEAEAGRDAFIKLNCIQCHSVVKTEFPALKATRRLELRLASEMRFVKKYEDIITAITNPKHVLTEHFRELLAKNELEGSIEPLMPDLTKDMSARQLMDIVTFLDQAYSKSLPDYRGKGASPSVGASSASP